MDRNNLKERQFSQKQKNTLSPNSNQLTTVIPGLTRDPQAMCPEQNFHYKTNRNLNKSVHHIHPQS